MLCSVGESIGCFGEYLPEDVVTKWANGVRTQLVFEAEILPYLLSLSLWGDRLRGCKLPGSFWTMRQLGTAGSADMQMPRLHVT